MITFLPFSEYSIHLKARKCSTWNIFALVDGKLFHVEHFCIGRWGIVPRGTFLLFLKKTKAKNHRNKPIPTEPVSLKISKNTLWIGCNCHNNNFSVKKGCFSKRQRLKTTETNQSRLNRFR